MSLPKDILFATSTASYQIEGAWQEDGKGENIWDRETHKMNPRVHNNDNGDVACDSYHKYQEDIDLLQEIGFHMYRFSISWARILPDGDITNINEKGIAYYNNLIDELLLKNIQPMVTMYHWDLPQKLQDMGGLMNPLMIDYFVDYADLLFQRFGDRVKWWITFNEPFEVISGYASDSYAPALCINSPGDYIVGHTILCAHGKTYRLYEKEYKASQNGKISITLSSRYYEGKTKSTEDTEAAERARIFNLDWFSHPIYSVEGDYHPLMKELVAHNSKKEGRSRSRLPSFTEEEIKEIRGAFDFFALNHYTTRLCEPGIDTSYGSMGKDMNVIFVSDSSWPTAGASWLKVVPWGFRKLLQQIKDLYDNPPVFITENGYGDKTGELNDKLRISYYKDYLTEMSKAINDDGCNVIGYTAWSLLDNFEWMDGYGIHFGIVQVDFEDPDRKRTKKSSAKFFQELIATCVVPNKTDFFWEND